MPIDVAVIGDLFMLPEIFEQKLRGACGEAVAVRTRRDDWPDRPMARGYATPGMEGLKEYFGTPEGVADFVGDAEVLVTHLAPISRSVLEALPG